MRSARECAFSIAVIVIASAGCAFGGTIAGRVKSHNGNLNLHDAVVWIDDMGGPVPAPGRVAIVDQRGLRFVPHVLVIQVGTTVEFANSDPLAHNVFSISSAKRFNLGLYKRGDVRRVTFDKPGIVQLLCNVHQEMSGFIVVVPGSHYVRPAADGSFLIRDVPAGKHRLHYWHEDAGEHVYEIDVPANGVVHTTVAID